MSKHQLPYLLVFIFNCSLFSQTIPYALVDTDVAEFYSDNELITAPSPGDPFYGQDATYMGNSPSYTNPGDGTIIDQVTGLSWEKNMGKKVSYSEAFIKADSLTLVVMMIGGYLP